MKLPLSTQLLSPAVPGLSLAASQTSSCIYPLQVSSMFPFPAAPVSPSANQEASGSSEVAPGAPLWCHQHLGTSCPSWGQPQRVQVMVLTSILTFLPPSPPQQHEDGVAVLSFSPRAAKAPSVPTAAPVPQIYLGWGRKGEQGSRVSQK